MTSPCFEAKQGGGGGQSDNTNSTVIGSEGLSLQGGVDCFFLISGARGGGEQWRRNYRHPDTKKHD